MDAATPATVEHLITLRAAAKAFGVGRHLLYRAAEAGELEVLDIGSWPRVRLSAVQQWLESTRRLPRGPAA
jgi:excisionase family DNA binding protein